MDNNVELCDFEISPFGRPDTPGVYAVWARNDLGDGGVPHLLYIGSSLKIGKRLKNEKHPYMIAYRRLNGLVYVSFFETNDRLNLEAMLIKKYRPIMNIQGKK